jgi:putative endonuclease
MEWYVYILEMSNGKYYIWSTRDLETRIAMHQKWWVNTTKKILPVHVKYTRQYATIKEAIAQEKYLKRMKSRKMIEQFMEWH